MEHTNKQHTTKNTKKTCTKKIQTPSPLFRNNANAMFVSQQGTLSIPWFGLGLFPRETESKWESEGRFSEWGQHTIRTDTCGF
jgi:hypothetical protein